MGQKNCQIIDKNQPTTIGCEHNIGLSIFPSTIMVHKMIDNFEKERYAPELFDFRYKKSQVFAAY